MITLLLILIIASLLIVVLVGSMGLMVSATFMAVVKIVTGILKVIGGIFIVWCIVKLIGRIKNGKS